MTAQPSGSRLTFVEPPNRLMIEMLLIFTGVFLIYMIVPPIEVFAREFLALNSATFLSKFYLWQPVTSIFLHASIGHFIGNMIFFYIFGSALANAWQRKEFLIYFFTCGIGASLCSYLYNVATGAPSVPTMGASGAIFGLMAAFALTVGERVFYLFFVIPMKGKHLVYILFAIEVLLVWRGTQDGIGHIAHVTGAIIGWGYVKIVQKQQRRLAGITYGKADAGSRLGGLEVMDDND